MAHKYGKRKTFVEDEPKEANAFGNFQKAKLEKTSEEAILNYRELMLKLGPDVYISFLIIGSDDALKREVKEWKYSKETVAKLSGVHGMRWVEQFEGAWFRVLCRAAAACVGQTATNDNGEAYTAMQGDAELKNGRWIVKKPKTNGMTVQSSSHAARDLQLFTSATAVGVHRRRVVDNDSGVVQQVNVPCFINANHVEDQQIPAEIKRVFCDSLLVIEGEQVSPSIIAKAPWIWKAIFASIRNIKVPIIGIPLEILYFTVVKLAFDYTPAPISIEDVLYGNYPLMLKELVRQVAKRAIYVGGVFLNKFHYFNEGAHELRCKLIGGNVPVKWCAYNTVTGITWERQGAFVESDLLDTKVETVRPVSQFTGMFYDPIGQTAPVLTKCAGLILPYGQDSKGLNILLQWVSIQTPKTKYKMWCTYGPCPLLWVEARPDGVVWNQTAAETLWRSLPVMNLYNYAASLNRLTAKGDVNGVDSEYHKLLTEMHKDGIPAHPISLCIYHQQKKTKYTETSVSSNGQVKKKTFDVPKFQVKYFATTYIPGRHKVQSTLAAVEEYVEAFDEFAEFASQRTRTAYASRKGKARDTPDAPEPTYYPAPEHSEPKAKRSKSSFASEFHKEDEPDFKVPDTPAPRAPDDTSANHDDGSTEVVESEDEYDFSAHVYTAEPDPDSATVMEESE